MVRVRELRRSGEEAQIRKETPEPESDPEMEFYVNIELASITYIKISL